MTIKENLRGNNTYLAMLHLNTTDLPSTMSPTRERERGGGGGIVVVVVVGLV